MPINPDIHQAIVAMPAIDMYNAVRAYLAPNNSSQFGLRGIWDDLGEDAIVSLEQTKDDGFSTCSAFALATNTYRAKVGFVDVGLASKRRLGCKILACTNRSVLEDHVDATNRTPGQFSRILGRKNHRKQVHNLSKIGLADLRTTKVTIFSCESKKLACVEHMFAS
jgi:hypothetical protein